MGSNGFLTNGRVKAITGVCMKAAGRTMTITETSTTATGNGTNQS
jgi:hypothetical protein